MTDQDSAIAQTTTPISARAGLWWGLLGVAAFSLTVPFTRVAVEDGAMSPLFTGSARAVIAALLAAVALTVTRSARPTGRLWWRVAVVAGGVVVGFPVLTSFALTDVPASHGAVVIGVLPAATAIVTVIRTRERPSTSFWLAATVGAIGAIAFAALQGGGLGGLHASDALLFAAVVAAAFGYAEGGLLAREIGAWQTVSWALVLAFPLMSVLTAFSISTAPPRASTIQWAAFAYLAVVSMYLGFFAWYRGLAIGPMAQVSQTQLAQPVMTICWAALLLGEQITLATVAGGIVVISSALLAVRSRNKRPAVPAPPR